MNRILVTGAAGFIGSSLVDQLLAEGDEVVGLDNFDDYYDPAIKRSNLVSAEATGRFSLLESDLRDRDAMFAGLRESRPDVVVHLAARAGVRPSLEDPKLYQEVNVGGTVNLLDAMLDAGCKRLVFGSTSSVYGQASEPPFREDTVTDRPISPYAATKRAAEMMCYTYSHLYGMRTTCLRFFTVYGPRQRPEMAIHKFCRLIDQGEPIPMFGDGESYRDYTYVDDIIAGVVGAVRHDEVYDIYNLGGTQTTGLRELIDTLAKELGKPVNIQQLDGQPGDVPATCADVSKAGAAFGFAPKVPVSEGLRRFVAWYREQQS